MPYATSTDSVIAAIGGLNFHAVHPGALPDVDYIANPNSNNYITRHTKPNLLSGIRAGNVPVQVYRHVRRAAIVRNTDAEKRYMPREAMYPVSERFTEAQIIDALTGISETASRPARRYSDFVVTPPARPPPLAFTCRLRHRASGIDDVAEIAAWRMSASVADGGNLKANSLTLTLAGDRK